jgi:hypothetical protein
VRVGSRLFRRLFLEGLMAAFEAGILQFFADLALLRLLRSTARPTSHLPLVSGLNGKVIEEIQSELIDTI